MTAILTYTVIAAEITMVTLAASIANSEAIEVVVLLIPTMY